MAKHPAPLKIMHVFRAPKGGLFRHVADLAQAQAARGHHVGLIADSSTGGAIAEAALARLAPYCTLGIARIPMSRHLGPGDVIAIRNISRHIAETAPDIVHGHGAKGAAFSRLAARRGACIACTPHGGVLHFRRNTPAGFLYIVLEKMLLARTDLFLFESEFAAKSFCELIGTPRALMQVAHNGLHETEFADVALANDASDLLYIGELRELKGVDILLDAIAHLHATGLPVTATLVGDGPDREAFQAQAERLSLTKVVRFKAPMPAREAFALGKIAVVPSRRESLPYIVLELAAAGKPIVATRAGGIAEIFGPQSERLIAPGDSLPLAETLKHCIKHPETMADQTQMLRERIRKHFSIENMVESGLAAYRSAIMSAKR
jgi:glycosyltransferase involved in cell wall biosynthesis